MSDCLSLFYLFFNGLFNILFNSFNFVDNNINLNFGYIIIGCLVFSILIKAILNVPAILKIDRSNKSNDRG